MWNITMKVKKLHMLAIYNKYFLDRHHWEKVNIVKLEISKSAF